MKNVKKQKKENILFLYEELNRLYPDPQPSLNFETNYQLLVAVILSAQCTDERVNKVTQILFADCPLPDDILALGQKGLIKYISSCGFYNVKSKNIISMTNDILCKYDGKVPAGFDELQTLAGVGEKTAGVVLAQAFHKPAFPVDTHIFRLAHRLGLSENKYPNKVSIDLKKIFPKKRWIDLHLQFIFHGRVVCFARKPRCIECSLLNVCPFGEKLVFDVL